MTYNLTGPDTGPRDRARLRDAEPARQAKRRALRLAVVSAGIQTLAKAGVGFYTGSLALLGTAADSLGDFLNVAIARMAVGLGGRPPDLEHPFGHGKAESLGAFLQALVILPVAGVLLWRGIDRLFHGGAVGHTWAALAVMVGALGMGAWTARRLHRVAGQTESLALTGTGVTFGVDAFTHGGVILALVIVQVTGWTGSDALASLGLAVFVIWQSVRLAWRSAADLLDLQIPEIHRRRVIEELEEHAGEFLDYHRLRTRRAGPEKHIDFHLTICRYRTLEEAHGLVDHLENAIEAIVPQSQVIVHVDPCKDGETCPGEARCELARLRRGLLPPTRWPAHPTGPEAREQERREHPCGPV
jgi:ferrous-iron efflux pump FieF